MASKNKTHYEAVNEIEDLIEAVEGFEPETELGLRLKELALRGLEEGVEPLTVDEVMDYLGRPAYA